jgi:hypothetical protein
MLALLQTSTRVLVFFALFYEALLSLTVIQKPFQFHRFGALFLLFDLFHFFLFFLYLFLFYFDLLEYWRSNDWLLLNLLLLFLLVLLIVLLLNFMLTRLCALILLFIAGSINGVDSHGRVSPTFFWFAFIVLGKLSQILQESLYLLLILLVLLAFFLCIEEQSILQVYVNKAGTISYLCHFIGEGLDLFKLLVRGLNDFI